MRQVVRDGRSCMAAGEGGVWDDLGVELCLVEGIDIEIKSRLPFDAGADRVWCCGNGDQ